MHTSPFFILTFFFCRIDALSQNRAAVRSTTLFNFKPSSHSAFEESTVVVDGGDENELSRRDEIEGLISAFETSQVDAATLSSISALVKELQPDLQRRFVDRFAVSLGVKLGGVAQDRSPEVASSNEIEYVLPIDNIYRLHLRASPKTTASPTIRNIIPTSTDQHFPPGAVFEKYDHGSFDEPKSVLEEASMPTSSMTFVAAAEAVSAANITTVTVAKIHGQEDIKSFKKSYSLSAGYKQLKNLTGLAVTKSASSSVESLVEAATFIAVAEAVPALTVQKARSQVDTNAIRKSYSPSAGYKQLKQDEIAKIMDSLSSEESIAEAATFIAVAEAVRQTRVAASPASKVQSENIPKNSDAKTFKKSYAPSAGYKRMNMKDVSASRKISASVPATLFSEAGKATVSTSPSPALPVEQQEQHRKKQEEEHSALAAAASLPTVKKTASHALEAKVSPKATELDVAASSTEKRAISSSAAIKFVKSKPWIPPPVQYVKAKTWFNPSETFSSGIVKSKTTEGSVKPTAGDAPIISTRKPSAGLVPSQSSPNAVSNAASISAESSADGLLSTTAVATAAAAETSSQVAAAAAAAHTKPTALPPEVATPAASVASMVATTPAHPSAEEASTTLFSTGDSLGAATPRPGDVTLAGPRAARLRKSYAPSAGYKPVKQQDASPARSSITSSADELSGRVDEVVEPSSEARAVDADAPQAPQLSARKSYGPSAGYKPVKQQDASPASSSITSSADELSGRVDDVVEPSSEAKAVDADAPQAPQLSARKSYGPSAGYKPVKQQDASPASSSITSSADELSGRVDDVIEPSSEAKAVDADAAQAPQLSATAVSNQLPSTTPEKKRYFPGSKHLKISNSAPSSTGQPVSGDTRTIESESKTRPVETPSASSDTAAETGLPVVAAREFTVASNQATVSPEPTVSPEATRAVVASARDSAPPPAMESAERFNSIAARKSSAPGLMSAKATRQVVKAKTWFDPSAVSASSARNTGTAGVASKPKADASVDKDNAVATVSVAVSTVLLPPTVPEPEASAAESVLPPAVISAVAASVAASVASSVVSEEAEAGPAQQQQQQRDLTLSDLRTARKNFAPSAGYKPAAKQQAKQPVESQTFTESTSPEESLPLSDMDDKPQISDEDQFGGSNSYVKNSLSEVESAQLRRTPAPEKKQYFPVAKHMKHKPTLGRESRVVQTIDSGAKKLETESESESESQSPAQDLNLEVPRSVAAVANALSHEDADSAVTSTRSSTEETTQSSQRLPAVPVALEQPMLESVPEQVPVGAKAVANAVAENLPVMEAAAVEPATASASATSVEAAKQLTGSEKRSRLVSEAALTVSLQEKSPAELAQFAGNAFKKTTTGFITATAGIIDESKFFLSSSSADETRTAAFATTASANAASKSVLKGLETLKDEWNAVMSTVSNSGEFSEKIPQAIQKAVTSTDVKKSISDFGDNILKTAKEASAAGGFFAAGLGKQLSTSPKWEDGYFEVAEGLTMLKSVVSAAGAQIQGRKRPHSTLSPFKGPKAAEEETEDSMGLGPESAPKLDFTEDHYAVLEVDSKCDPDALKKAYHKMIVKYHPDNKNGKAMKELANKQMMVINNAYKILKDPSSRDVYDQQCAARNAPKKRVLEIKIDSAILAGIVRKFFKKDQPASAAKNPAA